MKNFTKSLLSLTLVVLLSGWATVAFAQPANDNCINAIALTSSNACVITTGNTTGGTSSGVPVSGSCSTTMPDDDIWYKFTALYAQHTITANSSAVGIVVEAFSGSCGALTSLGCAIPVSGTAAILTLNGLTVGNVYYFRTYSNQNGFGAVDVCVTHVPPDNDNCAGAVTLVSKNTCVSTNGNNALATNSGIAACVGAPDDDLWYKFTALYTQHTVQIGSGSIGPDVEAFSGSCGALTSIGCIANAPLVLNGLTVGNTYYLRTYSNGSGLGSIDICVTHLAPDNDNCSGALAFPISPASGCSYTAVSTANATQSAGNPSCTASGNDDDVWYTFTPTVTGPLLISYNSLVSITGTATTVVYEFYTGTCGALVPVAGSCGGIGITGATDDNETTVSVTAGVTYFMRLWAGGTTNSASFNLCLRIPPPAPVQDECATATLLTSNTTCTNTAGTTVSATASGVTPAACNPNDDDDVWFKFVAVATTHKVTVSSPVGFTGVVIDARSGACPGTSIGCVTTGGGAVLTLPGLTIGNTYYLRIYSGGLNVGTFNICVTHGDPLPIELKSFTGKVEANTNVLSWETVTEKNVQSHIVERSIDGNRWSEVGRKDGKADSQVSVKYTLEDRVPLTRAYYRLRSVDFDGKENISASVVLTRKSDQFEVTSVFPSPTVDNVTVQFNATQEEKVVVRVMDATGRLVLEKTIEAAQGINELPLTLNGLQAGFYTVKVSNSTSASAPVRFVKQ